MQAAKKDIQTLGRLQKRSDFLRANGVAKKWVSKGIIVLILPNDLEKRRFGITVTKKLEKSAVRRNRMKRRLRAVCKDVLPAYGTAGTDYILIARPDTATRPYTDLKQDLVWCLKKLQQQAALPEQKA